MALSPQVHHFCTYPHGGAATAAIRLHSALLEQGTTSSFYYTLSNRSPPDQPPLVQLTYASPRQIPLWSMVRQRLRRAHVREIYRLYREHLERRPPHLETFSMAEQPEQTHLPAMFTDQSVIHLHWIAYLADYPSFFGSLPPRAPIIWTLHDMNPFTGGCHFSGGCDRYVVGCGNCPQVVQPRPDDVSRHSWAIKQRAWRQRQIHVVAPSRWMVRLAQQSPIWPAETAFSVIRYGIDVHRFHPVDKPTARARLGISPEATVMGFVADQLANPRKGAEFLWQALAARDDSQQLELLTMGAGDIPISLPGIGRTHTLGFISDPDQQALAYSACDFVVIPSVEDNQPQVAVEALACGTPVIGFDSGGLSEFVLDGIHGLIVPVAQVTELTRAIAWMTSHPDQRIVMGQRGRLAITREFDGPTQAAKYLTLYRDELHQVHRHLRAA